MPAVGLVTVQTCQSYRPLSNLAKRCRTRNPLLETHPVIQSSLTVRTTVGAMTDSTNGRRRVPPERHRGAVTLRHNAYKVPLMQNLVKWAIRGEAAWTS